jgi:hypothetical protein
MRRNTYTEGEARKKWCPFSRADMQRGTGNRYTGDAVSRSILPGACRCIATDCMAWVVDSFVDEKGWRTEGGRCGLVNQP